MLVKLGAEHTVDVDLLPEEPTVLDVGARGFEFDVELLKIRPKAKIIALEPDPKVKDPGIEGVIFLNAAMTENVVAEVEWQGPGEGGFVCGSSSGYGWSVTDAANFAIVKNVTLGAIMNEHKIYKWDLVKLDCEGSEFGILENWPGAIATQLSVEFHDFVDRNRWNDAYYDRLFSGPLINYKAVLWGLTGMGPGNHQGHWDTLLVLR